MSVIDENTLLLDPHTETGQCPKAPTLKGELAIVLRSAGPLIFTFVLQYCIPIISILSVGHLGPQELSAASLAIMSFSITGISIFQGMATALDTMCAQAYGAGRPTLVGVYVQRCTALTLTLLCGLAGLWWYSGAILSLMVPDREICYMAQGFMRVLMLGAPGLILFETGKRFLQAQQCFRAGSYTLAAALPLNLLLQFGLVWNPSLSIGFLGSPLAVTLTYWLMAALLFGYVVLVEGRACWGGLNLREAFSAWSPMMALALPGVIMVEAEFLAFEVLTILASQFGTTTLAAQAIVANTSTVFFQIPFGVSVAVVTRIGHHVGASDPVQAQWVVTLASTMGAVIATANCLLIAVFRFRVCRLFSADEAVVRLASRVMLILALNQLVDGLNVTFAGCLRGQGRQRIGSIWNLVAYYLIALPLCYCLAFPWKMELYGLWAGLGVGVAVLALAEGVCVALSDWTQIVADSQTRLQS